MANGEPEKSGSKTSEFRTGIVAAGGVAVIWPILNELMPFLKSSGMNLTHPLLPVVFFGGFWVWLIFYTRARTDLKKNNGRPKTEVE